MQQYSGKRTAKIALVFFVLAAAAILADWLTAFGQREAVHRDFVHLTYRAVDARSAQPIGHVHIACTRRVALSTCTEQQGENPGETVITLSTLRRITRTLLFHRHTEFSFGSVDSVSLAFIHPDYLTHALELTGSALPAALRQVTVVRLNKKQTMEHLGTAQVLPAENVGIQ